MPYVCIYRAPESQMKHLVGISDDRLLRPAVLLTASNPSTYYRAMPRKVILGFGISLDGYIARRNGDLDFLVIDKEGEALMADFFSKIDIVSPAGTTAHAASGLVKVTVTV